eukprot:301563-Pyramimonas_sp.AAC.1
MTRGPRQETAIETFGTLATLEEGAHSPQGPNGRIREQWVGGAYELRACLPLLLLVACAGCLPQQRLQALQRVRPCLRAPRGRDVSHIHGMDGTVALTANRSKRTKTDCRMQACRVPMVQWYSASSKGACVWLVACNENIPSRRSMKG